MSLELMYITNNPDIALIAEKAGVNRIWIDLETLGKDERQKGMNSVKSHHSIEDISRISKLLTTSKMQVRINPWNDDSINEINRVLLAGAEYIMLPMWKTKDEVVNFIDAVAGRATTILLLETREAESCLDEILKLKGIDQIHIGLNDLHLSYGLKFMFELLSNGTVERICKKIEKKGIMYGFGGISHLGDGVVPAEMIVMEHYRLGSSMAILSRGFCDTTLGELADIEQRFISNVADLRNFESKINLTMLLSNQERLKEKIDKFVKDK